MSKRMTAILAAILVAGLPAHADVLHLRSGATIQGTFLGASVRELQFLGNDGVPRSYQVSDIDEIRFSSPHPRRLRPSLHLFEPQGSQFLPARW
jgi:hypothetical protein